MYQFFICLYWMTNVKIPTCARWEDQIPNCTYFCSRRRASDGHFALQKWQEDCGKDRIKHHNEPLSLLL